MAAAPTNNFNSDSSAVPLDLGLIDVRSDHHLWLPLQDLGIADSTRIVSASVSCECVRLDLAEQLTGDGRWRPVLGIVIRGDVTAPSAEIHPVGLAVKVNLELNSGETRELTLAFTHALIRISSEDGLSELSLGRAVAEERPLS